MTRVDLAVLGTDGTVGGPGGSPLSGGGGAGGGTGNVTDRGAWATATAYNLHDIVSYGGTTWRCTFAHTSTTTFDDTKWAELDQHRGAWQANVRYEAGDTVISSGVLYSAITAFTSSGSFNAANWNVVGGTSATANVTDRGAWAASTVYNLHDLVEYGGTDFLCAVAHTSGAAFDTTKWTELSQFRGAWQASTVYETGDIVAQGGSLYSANATFTSGASFNVTNWTLLSGSGGGASVAWKNGQWYVDLANGNDSTGVGSIGAPYASISKAVSLAGNGDTIWIANGTYTESVYIQTQVTLRAMGNPGASTATRGVTVKAPSNTADCIVFVGAGANQAAIYGICTLGLGPNWTGCGVRGIGASYVILDNWVHSGGGTPTKAGGGIGLAASHGEQWQITGTPHISNASRGLVWGVEADQHFIENLHLSVCYQEMLIGPFEAYRSPLASAVTNSAATFPIGNSLDLPATGVGFTQDPIPAPAAPVPTTSASGGTIAAGIYQVQVTYTNQYGETVASASGSVTAAGGASTITIPSPAASNGATGWYAYVTQAGGSTYTRQQAYGSPTAIGTSLTLSAPPTSTGSTQPTGTSAFFSEGIAWAGNAANQLTGVTRAVVGSLGSAINASQTTITVWLLAPGNKATNGLLNPWLVNNLPPSGAVQIDGEQISYTSLLNVGNGSYNLQGVTRGANSSTAASHSQNTAVGDVAKASAVAHGSGVYVTVDAGGSNMAGAWSGGYTVLQSKSASVQPQFPGDYVVDIFSGGTMITPDFSESGNANTPRIRQSCTGLKLLKPAFAVASTLTDDGTQTSYDTPNGGAVVLSALSQNCVVENNVGTTFTNNGTGNRFAALRWNASALSFAVTGVDAASMGDQKVLYLDQASGLLKWTSALTVPSGAAAGDLFEYNGSTLTRIPIGSSNQVLTVSGGVPVWAAPSGGGGSRIQAMQGALGLVTENFRAPIGANTTNATSQRVNAGLIGLLAGDVITNIIVGVNTLAVGTAPTLVRLGLADTTGKILAVTANVNSSTAFTALGYAVIPLSAPYTVPTTGGYYALYLQNGAWGTTNLGLNYATGANTGNTLAITGGALFYAAQSGQTDLPAVGLSLTLADAGNSASPLWYGVS